MQKHHIIPKSLGGTDEASNLILLTPVEHCKAHLKLFLDCPPSDVVTKYKLCNAFEGCLHSNKYIIPHFYNRYKDFVKKEKKRLWCDLHYPLSGVDKGLWLYSKKFSLPEKLHYCNNNLELDDKVSLRLLIGKYDFPHERKHFCKKLPDEVNIRVFGNLYFIDLKVKHLGILK